MTISWGKTLRVWWSAAWRGAIYGIVGGFVAGGIAGALAGATGHLPLASFYGRIAGLAVSFPASMLALKQALNKNLPMLASVIAEAASAQTHNAGTPA